MPIVSVKDGEVFANSRDVAAFFEKQHKNVLQAIEALDCSVDFTRLNFQPSSYKDSTGRTLPSMDMTRDGFMFLAMGFTGAKAAAFKEAYIAAFNAMEAELRKPRAIDVRDPATLACAPARRVSGVFADRHYGARTHTQSPFLPV